MAGSRSLSYEVAHKTSVQVGSAGAGIGVLGDERAERGAAQLLVGEALVEEGFVRWVCDRTAPATFIGST